MRGHSAASSDLICSGEALHRQSCSGCIVDACPTSICYNLYGPTEDTTIDCALVASAAMTADDVPIGRPIWNTRVYVLDGGLAACAGGGCGRALHRGRGACAGLSGSCGADGGAVCGRPVWACGEPDVPHRGSGALARGRGAGVPRACGRAGEAARLPHRAWRDRGGAAAPCRGGAGGGDCARGCGRAASGWSPMWWRRRMRALGCGGAAGACWRERFRTTWCRRRSWCWSGCR